MRKGGVQNADCLHLVRLGMVNFGALSRFSGHLMNYLSGPPI